MAYASSYFPFDCSYDRNDCVQFILANWSWEEGAMKVNISFSIKRYEEMLYLALLDENEVVPNTDVNYLNVYCRFIEFTVSVY